MLEIFHNLFKELHANDVIFCNWKGGHAVKSHLDGYGDLDLFVPIRCKAEFEKIVESEGFRRVISYQADHDFIEHYYGLDEPTFKFSHIHVYFKIVTGEHVSKNYILPLDSYILANLNTSSNLPTINVKGGRSIFLIRYFLKIGSLYGLLQLWREVDKYLNEWNSFGNYHEYNYENISELGLSAHEVRKMSDIYESSSLCRKILFSLRLKRKLKKFSRRSYFQLLGYNFINIIIRLLNKLVFKKQKLLSPGFVVAICGLDGSGKSSIVSSLEANFSNHFSVKALHLGRPASNMATIFINPFISIISFYNRLGAGKKKSHTLKSNDKISIIYALRSVLLAYDRKIQTIKAHKLSKSGHLVVCDRYPGLEQGKMDSPRIPIEPTRGTLYNFCYNLEQKLYKLMKPANIIIQLSVPLEVAIDRNNRREKFGKETEDELRQRFDLNVDATFLAKYYYFIDATMPFKKVLSEVSGLIWRFKEISRKIK